MNGLVLRSLGVLSRSCAGSAQEAAVRAFATGASPSKKDVLYNLNNPDPDAVASVKSYLTSLYNGAKLEPSSADDSLELTSKIEKKYKAAAIVEYGLQNISVPLDYSKSNLAPVKRYAAELRTLGKQAGFEDPAVEVSKRLADTAATADSVKELLSKNQSLMSPELYAALLEAVQQVENSTNSTVTLDGSSPAYKAFAKNVEGIATAHGIPAKLLVDVKKGSTDDAVVKEYARYQQHAAVQDAIAELEALKADATVLLDKHLGKSAEQVRKEQAATLAAAIKKAEAAKGAPWAVQFLEDVKRVEWFDACVAENPAVGPKVAA
ncbi:hypothetical protein PLESTB_000205000 [Pleodorina starrii]|uniref:Uncharacterized protein n=1 Tax=Pleodorina starrii TaxID=330485 RepID=A0A9W6EYQ0_9CHLO|nr:hypothetical protein PLESTM_000326500 [Pleodorina starrii]GLC49306.1 hypothetical protein PLESTB_000205000 [Pleodorina starrii]GLC73436.1 hypothetical protein PLESTF_001375400 [Pleodorina starrii]